MSDDDDDVLVFVKLITVVKDKISKFCCCYQETAKCVKSY